MARPQLRVAVGQCSLAGRKPVNQDFHGALVPTEPQLSRKGIAIALADGISSSTVSHVASAAAVRSLLDDYYCTSAAWSVEHSAECVLRATNSWLHAQTRRGPNPYDPDSGYVCTLTALILKGQRAHAFHAGDSRLWRLDGATLEPLTTDHRVHLSSEQSHLARAMGMGARLEIEHVAMDLAVGDTFVLSTDGVHEHLTPEQMVHEITAAQADLDAAARRIVERALEQGSGDNLTVQVVRVLELPAAELAEFQDAVASLALPPPLEPRAPFDGYTVLRELHASHRSHLHLAKDGDDGQLVVLKTPSTDLRDDRAYLERFAMEEWIAQRINSPHVLKAVPATRPRRYLYVATEYIEGQTLAQWMIDHPRPALDTARKILAQIAAGLRAFHKMEMIHQDLRPANVMLEPSGTVKIIDFGATRVAGLAERQSAHTPEPILGTEQYAAPEYFVGTPVSSVSDIYSLGVIAYQMLTGQLPYGIRVSQCRTTADLARLRYLPALDSSLRVPAWVDGALRKAVHPDPAKRYQDAAEFIYDLTHPNPAFQLSRRAPLLQRDPLLFWKSLSLALLVLCVVLLRWVHG